MRMRAVLAPVLLVAASGPSFLGDGTATAHTPGGTLAIAYPGVVSGDTFTGTVGMGFAQAPYTGVRIGRESADGR